MTDWVLGWQKITEKAWHLTKKIKYIKNNLKCEHNIALRYKWLIYLCIFYISKVNPSDCVDMDCDAKKKTILKDLDGSFLGAVGAVVPQSEYEWNGNPRHGLGDYRIPKVMLTHLNGSRIPVNQIAPYKGTSAFNWLFTPL